MEKTDKYNINKKQQLNFQNQIQKRKIQKNIFFKDKHESSFTENILSLMLEGNIFIKKKKLLHFSHRFSILLKKKL